MIVDTSALVAAATLEPGADQLVMAMLDGGTVPAPVIVEFVRVVTGRGARKRPDADAFLDTMLTHELHIEAFTAADARLATSANLEHGKGNDRGGTLNFGDLMVYAMAVRLDVPILCTGREFAATGIAIHPASRLD